jgi:hypothetical protein
VFHNRRLSEEEISFSAKPRSTGLTLVYKRSHVQIARGSERQQNGFSFVSFGSASSSDGTPTTVLYRHGRKIGGICELIRRS